MEDMRSVNAPSPPQLPVDPNLAAEQAQAQNDLIASTQAQTQGDAASLMARYGTRLAFSGAGPAGSPLSVPVGTSRSV